MLKQLFRTSPKWQSPKSQRRIEAVGEFQPGESADLEILTRLAKDDSEPAVRREAVKKLHDLNLLTQIQRRDLESMVRDAAALRINELLAGKCNFSPDVDARIERIRQINSPQVLCYLIKEAQPIDVKIASVEQLSDEIYLEEIALRSSIARLRQTAAERISNPKILENLANQSKNSDKSVYRIAKDKLGALDSLERSRTEIGEKLSNLCDAMEQHSRAAFNPLYKAKAESLIQQWQALAAQATPVQAERFETAYGVSQNVVAEHVQHEQREQQAAQAVLEQVATCEALEQALQELQQAPDSFDMPALAALVKTQNLRWDVAAELSAPADGLKSRYRHGMEQLEKARSLMEAVQSKREELESTIESVQNAEAGEKAEELPALSSLVEAMPIGKGLPLPSILKMAYGLLERQPPEPEKPAAPSPEELQKRKQLTTKLDQLEAAVVAGNTRQASKKLREAQQYAREQHLFDARLGSLVHKLQELKDWAGYAVLPKKQALLRDMEALSERTMDPDEKADTIKHMQDEWKSLGVTDPHVETPLWDQFKAASDRAYEPCRAYFNEQREMRAAHLAKRREICDELEKYLDNPPSPLNGKHVDALIRAAKQEWQRHYPVERQFAQQVQQRFGKLIKKLEALLAAEYGRHESAKQELIKTVQGLLAAEDVKTACDQAKAAQQQWKTLGQAHPKVDHALWKEFRALCDQLFAKRDAAVQAKKSAQDALVQRAQELIASQEQLADAALRGEATRADGEQLREVWRELHLPREQQALQQRFEKAGKQFEQNLKQAKQRQQDAQLQQLLDALKAVGDAELALANGGDAPALPETSLSEPWQAVLGKRKAALQEAMSGEEARQHWLTQVNGEAQAGALCLELEILLDLPSPAAQREARLQRQMEMLQKNAFHRGSEQKDDKVKSLLKSLMGAPSLDAAAQPQTLERLTAILHGANIRV